MKQFIFLAICVLVTVLLAGATYWTYISFSRLYSGFFYDEINGTVESIEPDEPSAYEPSIPGEPYYINPPLPENKYIVSVSAKDAIYVFPLTNPTVTTTKTIQKGKEVYLVYFENDPETIMTIDEYRKEQTSLGLSGIAGTFLIGITSSILAGLLIQYFPSYRRRILVSIRGKYIAYYLKRFIDVLLVP